MGSQRASSLEGLALCEPCRQAATPLFACAGCSGMSKRGAGGTQKAKQKEGRKKERKTLGNISVLVAASDSGPFISGAILGGLPHTDCKMHTSKMYCMKQHRLPADIKGSRGIHLLQDPFPLSHKHTRDHRNSNSWLNCDFWFVGGMLFFWVNATCLNAHKV